MLRNKNLHVHLSKKIMYILHTYICIFFFFYFPLHILFISILRLSKVVLRQIQTIQDALKKRNERNSRKNDTSDTVCISHNFYCAIRIELCKNLLFMPQKESRFFLRPVRSHSTCRAQEPKNASVFHYHLMGLLYARTQQKS